MSASEEEEVIVAASSQKEEKDDDICFEKSKKMVYRKLKKRLAYNIKEWQVIRKALEREGGELSACVGTCLSEINAHLLELNRKMEGVIIEMDEKLCVAETERKKEETREWVETVSV